MQFSPFQLFISILKPTTDGELFKRMLPLNANEFQTCQPNIFKTWIFQTIVLKNREIWPKTGRSLELVEFVNNITVNKVMLNKQLMTTIIMGSVSLMVFNVFINL